MKSIKCSINKHKTRAFHYFFLIGIITLLFSSFACAQTGKEQAVAWILAQQRADGYWGEDATKLRDTAAVLQLLADENTAEANNARATLSANIASYVPQNSGEIAQKIIIMSMLGMDTADQRQELLRYKTPQPTVTYHKSLYTPQITVPTSGILSGRMDFDANLNDFILAPGGNVTLLDTALAAQALLISDPANQQEYYEILDYFMSENCASNPVFYVMYCTSKDIRRRSYFFGSIIGNAYSAVIEDVPRFADSSGLLGNSLLSGQNSDGGYGESSTWYDFEASTVYQTALVYLAISRLLLAYPYDFKDTYHVNYYGYKPYRDRAIQYLTNTQDPAGHWNNNVYDTALAAMAMKYTIIYENLTTDPKSIEADKPYVVDGDSVSFTAVIMNTGDDALTTKVRFYDGDPEAGGQPFGEDKIITIDQGQELIVQSDAWDTTGKNGNHDIFVVPDPDNTLIEYNETDNAVSIPVRVNTVKVNLVIEDVEISAVNTAYPYYTISGKVRNMGGVPLTSATTITAYEGDPMAGGVALPDSSDDVFPTLTPNAYRGFEFTIFKDNFPGYRHFYIKVDDGELIDEGNETDNIFDLGEILVPRKLFLSDFRVEKTNADAGEVVRLETDVRFLGKGLTGENIVVQFFDGTPGINSRQIGADYVIPTLADGDQITIAQDFDTTQYSGRVNLYTRTFFTAPEANEQDRKKDDNLLKKSLSIKSLNPDLLMTVNDMMFSGMASPTSAFIDVTFEVENLSDAAFTGVQVNLLDGEGLYGAVVDTVTLNLGPLEKKEFIRTVTLPSVGGVFTVTANIALSTPGDASVLNNVDSKYLKYGGTKRVVFDESHYPSVTIHYGGLCDPDTLKCNADISYFLGYYSKYAEAIEDAGYEVATLDRFQPITRDVLKKADVWVIVWAWNWYSEEEMQLINEFVQNGGSLLYIGEWNMLNEGPVRPFFEMYDLDWDPYIWRVGMYDPDYGPIWNDLIVFFKDDLIHTDFQTKYDVHTVVPNWTGHFRGIPSESVIILKTGSDPNEWQYVDKPVVVGIPPGPTTGKGKVIFTMDSNYFDSDTHYMQKYRVDYDTYVNDYSFNVADNKNFGLGLIDWLSFPELNFKDIFINEGDVTLSPAEEYQTEKVNIRIRARKMGFYGSNIPVWYYLENDSGYSAKIGEGLIPELRFGDYVNFNYEWTVNAPAGGTYRVRAVIDPENTITEDLENNNESISGPLVIKDLPVPEEFQFTLSKQAPQILPGGQAAFTVAMNNHTHYHVDARPRIVITDPDGDAMEPALADYSAQDALNFLDLEQKTFDYTWDANGSTPGLYKLKVITGEMSPAVVLNPGQPELSFEILPYATIETTATDKPQYTLLADTVDTVSVSYGVRCNPLEAQDVDVTLEILDSGGDLTQRLAAGEPARIEAGELLSNTVTWDPGTSYPGTYRARLTVRRGGQVVEESETTFELVEVPSIEAIFNVSQIDYTYTDTVGVNLKLKSLDKILGIENLETSIVFERSDGTLSDVEFADTVPLIPAGNIHEIDHTAAAGRLGPGDWTARAVVTLNGSVMAAEEKTFTIISSEVNGAGISGTLDVISQSGATVKPNDRLRADYTISNYSSIASIPVGTPVFLTVYTEDETLVEEHVLILKNAISRGSKKTSYYITDQNYYMPGNYVMILSIEINGTRFPLALDGIEVVENQPLGKILNLPEIVFQGSPFDAQVAYYNFTSSQKDDVVIKLTGGPAGAFNLQKTISAGPMSIVLETFTFAPITAAPGLYTLSLYECIAGSCRYLNYKKFTVRSTEFDGTVTAVPESLLWNTATDMDVDISLKNLSGGTTYSNVNVTVSAFEYDTHNPVTGIVPQSTMFSQILPGQTVTRHFDFDGVSLPENTYMFEMSAEFGFGQTPLAFEKYYVVASPPSAPENSTVSLINHQYMLSWTAPETRVNQMPLTNLNGFNVYAYDPGTSTYSKLNTTLVEITNPTFALTGFTTEQQAHVVVTAVDEFGLESTYGADAVFTPDGVQPVTTAAKQPPNMTWGNTNVTVALTATDDNSGVESMHYCMKTLIQVSCDPYSSGLTGSTVLITEHGARQVCFGSIDMAGNVESPVSCIDIYIDKLSPITTAEWVPGPSNWQQWVNTDVSVALNAADTESGVKNTRYCITSGEYAGLICDPFSGQTGSSVTISQNGKWKLCFASEDNVGNQEPAQCSVVWIDKSGPDVQGTGFYQPLRWKNTDISLRFLADDFASGVAEIFVCKQDAAAGDCDPFVQPPYGSDTMLIADQGKTRVCYGARDNIGNSSAVSCGEIWLDKAAPDVAPAGFPVPPDWSGNAVDIALNVQDSLSGVLITKYCTTDARFPYCNSAAGGIGDTVSISADGKWRICYTTIDYAANIATQCFEAWIDTQKPVTSVDGIAQPPAWTKSNVIVNLKPSDQGSGVAATYHCIVDATDPDCDPVAAGLLDLQLVFTDHGQKKFCVASVDNAGKTEDVHCHEVWIDKIGPTSLSASGFPSNNTWVEDDVAIKFTATDTGSGVADFYYCVQDFNQTQQACAPYTQGIIGDEVTITENGKWLVCYGVTDVAGNKASQPSVLCGMVWKTDLPSIPTLLTLNGDNIISPMFGTDATPYLCGSGEPGNGIEVFARSIMPEPRTMDKTAGAPDLSLVWNGANYHLEKTPMQITAVQSYNENMGAVSTAFLNDKTPSTVSLPADLPPSILDGSRDVYVYLTVLTVPTPTVHDVHLTIYSDLDEQAYGSKMQQLSANTGIPITVHYFAKAFTTSTPGLPGGIYTPAVVLPTNAAAFRASAGKSVMLATVDAAGNFCDTTDSLGDDGEKTLFAIATLNGFTSAPSADVTYFLDATPPQPPLLMTVDSKDWTSGTAIGNNPLPVITGTSEPNSKVTIYMSGPAGPQAVIIEPTETSTPVFAAYNAGNGFYNVSAPTLSLEGKAYTEGSQAYLVQPTLGPAQLPTNDAAEVNGTKDIVAFLVTLNNFQGTGVTKYFTLYSMGTPSGATDDQRDIVTAFLESLVQNGTAESYVIDAYGVAFEKQGSQQPYNAVSPISGFAENRISLTPIANATAAADGTFTAPVFLDLSPDGPKNITADAEDSIGNKSETSPQKVYLLDTQPPATTAQVPALWQNGDAPIVLTPSDDSSGVADTFYCLDTANTCDPATQGTSLTYIHAGGPVRAHYLRFYSTDAAGNIEQPVQSVLLAIDVEITGELFPIPVTQYQEPIFNYTITNRRTTDISGTVMGVIAPADWKPGDPFFASFEQRVDSLAPGAALNQSATFSSVDAPPGNYRLFIFFLPDGATAPQLALIDSVTVEACP